MPGAPGWDVNRGGGGENYGYVDTDGDGRGDTRVSGDSFGPDISPTRGGQTANGMNGNVSGGGGHAGGSSSGDGQGMGDFGGGGGGGGGGTVLCTYFTFERGWIDKKDYIGNSRFGKERLDEASLNGYHYWAVPLVKYLRNHKGSLREKLIFKLLVEGWIHQNSYTMGYREKGDWRGKVLMATMKPVCTLIGKYVGQSDYQSLWTGFNLPEMNKA